MYFNSSTIDVVMPYLFDWFVNSRTSYSISGHSHFQLIGFEFSDYRRLFSVAQPFLNVHQLVAFLGNDRPHFMGVQRLFDEFLAKVELHRRVSNHRIARQHELTVLLFGQLHHRRHDFAQRAHHLNNAQSFTEFVKIFTGFQLELCIENQRHFLLFSFTELQNKIKLFQIFFPAVNRLLCTRVKVSCNL
ncbi:unnamed protein product [Aphis gossypii]|uniref:Uncharacterized protein n=1 Tax=Aphis gossypii TaxID=80765 RepID=A0A9P0IY41_APHGO|nr:unnamed protein product [Aphis gossypii]